MSPASSFSPLSELSGERLLEFLQRTGMPRQVAEWRYLDTAFNRGRNRGIAWIHRGRIEGMIGLVPFQVAGAGQVREANWSCDWMLANPAAHPGMGILLLKQAIQDSNVLFAVGGNENTRRLLPRIATLTVPGAAVSLHLPLRMGALIERLRRRGLWRHLPLPRAAYMIPLRRVPRPTQAVRTESGLVPAAAPLIESEGRGHPAPAYDFGYVDWQIGRSPVLVSATSYGPPRGSPRAVALYWSPRDSLGLWRLAVWAEPDSSAQLSAVLRTAVRHVYERGGIVLSTIVSRLETERIDLLHSAGFVSRGSRALYYCASGAQASAPFELSGLSYLDTDLAYRF
jgi:hypothetical protein